jgi:phosphatidylinositol alpha-1,6-mannosyltransferase
LVTFDFPPQYGGIQHYAARLAAELSTFGNEVVVIAPRVSGDVAADATLRARVRRFRGSGAARVPGELIAFGPAAFAARRPRTIALSWLPALAPAAVPRGIRGPLTLLAHGTELDVRPGSMRDRAMRFAFARADRVVANSAAVATRVRSLGLASNVSIVHPGVDPAPLERHPAERPAVVFVGRLVARKGVDRLIDAIALLRERGVTLAIVGDGPQRQALVDRARDAGIADRVHFAGAVDDAARNAALGEAWCFAMPARREGGDVEGFGIVYLEAAMAGLPTIGGRDCGAEDAIEDGVTGLLVDGNDVAAIAAAIVRLIDDPAAAAAMGAAGRRRALESFSWRRTASTIADLAGLTAAG